MQSYSKEAFRIICAWCNKEIRSPEVGGDDTPESHGVCSSCAVAMGAPPELFGLEPGLACLESPAR